MELQKEINLLNTLIATQSVLYHNLRNYHWNVVGKNFLEYHSFFEELYSHQQESIDELAERIRALNDFPLSVMSKYLEWSLIEEEVEVVSSEDAILEHLESSYMTLVSTYNEFIEKIENHITEDLLIGLNSKHEENLWKIRALRS